MHLLKNSLFGDVFAACGLNNQCFVRNDGMDKVDVSVSLEAWNIAEESPSTRTFQATLEGGVSSTVRFQAPQDWGPDHFDAMIILVSDASSGKFLMEDSVFLWSLPKSIPNLVIEKATVTVHSIKLVEESMPKAVVTLSSDKLALYVTLTTLAQGRFEENVIVLRPNQLKDVTFVPMAKGAVIDIDLLRASIRVEHLALYAP